MKSLLFLAGLITVLPALSEAATAPRVSGMPLFFVENRGQASPDVRFILKRPELSAYFLDRQIVLSLREKTVAIELLNSQEPARVEGIEEMPGKANFILGGSPEGWVTDLPLHGSVAYRQVWNGIDMVYGGNGRTLKSEFRVQPGADPSQIRWTYGSRMTARVLADGSLSVSGEGLDLHEDAPVIYEERGNAHKPVQGSFEVFADGSVGFRLGAYDRDALLVIDPVITYSTFLGGSGQDEATAVALDASGDAVVVGYAASTNFAQSSPTKMRQNAGGVDAFVAKLHDLGETIVYCTYIGGSGDDRALAAAVDPQGNAYITGYTTSANFPVTTGAFQTKLGGPRDAFVVKLNAAGSALVYSSYLGGSGSDTGYGIAVNNGFAYVTGDTNSTNFPVQGAFQSTNKGGYDAFLTQMSITGGGIVFSTYLGGSADDHASAIAVNSIGNAFVVGSTYSPDFPVANALQTNSGGNQDAFVTKFNTNGASLSFSTYLGGSGGTVGLIEEADGVAVDSNGNVIVAGTTSSHDFPVTANAAQATYGGGNTDGFLVKLDPTGKNMLTSTYIGGSSLDHVTGVAVDPMNYILVVGYTASTDFPNIRSVQAANKGGYDGFLFKLNPVKYTMVYSTYLGGAGADAIVGVASDKLGNAIICGYTASRDFPIRGKAGSAQQYDYGPTNGFVAKIASGWAAVATFTGSNTRSWIPDYAHNIAANGLWQNFTFGLPGDVPIMGDWNGSGTMKIGIFRNGVWMLDVNGNGVWDGPSGGDRQITFGQAGDIPLVGDWNGSGTLKAGVFRNGYWILDMSGVLQGTNNNAAPTTFYYGLGTDTPVVGDWSGSGTTKVGVVRNGSWFLDYNGDYNWTSAADRLIVYGPAGAKPIVGDWDGSGVSKPGYFLNGKWVLSYDQNFPNYYGTSTIDFVFYYGPSSSTPLIGN